VYLACCGDWARYKKMTGDELSTLARRLTDSLLARQPTFSIFEKACRGFEESIRMTTPEKLGGSNHIVMDQLQRIFASIPSDEALWAQVLVGLWFCSNFPHLVWRELVRRDPNNSPRAIEHCYW